MATNHLFRSEECSGTHCGGESSHVCVDRRVHVFVSHSWDDGHNTREMRHRYEFEILGPCDGSCMPQVDLAPEAVALVEKFIATGEKGSYKTPTPAHELIDEYPDLPDVDDDDEPPSLTSESDQEDA